jgi:hypothetical protein
VPTTADFPTSRAARMLEALDGQPATVREAMFWALAAASERDWSYALKWLDCVEEQEADAPHTIKRMRREWTAAMKRDADRGQRSSGRFAR